MQKTLGMLGSPLNVQPYTDGPEPLGFQNILASWMRTWDKCYGYLLPLRFLSQLNIKLIQSRTQLPDGLRYFVRIRNPDLFFFEETRGIELGGIEITDHSPDGSNIEKRYPYLWASRRMGINAFAVSRYLKQRPSGQINRLPFRHAFRNQQFLNEWHPEAINNNRGQVCQFLPLRELHLEDINLVPPGIKDFLANWDKIGEFFAHSLAFEVFTGHENDIARDWLILFKKHLEQLASACMANATRETEAATLLKLPSKWIQVYNTRPDSGHWERGEGQFDSIDGRVMFTLDEISLLDISSRPQSFEFWLPQMVSTHAWIAEQRKRDFGSKRLRNILVELKDMCLTKFADQLIKDDWDLLAANRSLLLERLDWKPLVYRVVDLVSKIHRQHVAQMGIKHRPKALIEQIFALLSDEFIYFSTHRAYMPSWQSDLMEALKQLPQEAIVLVPRIPAALIHPLPIDIKCKVLAAEHCTKEHLIMLRQLHRDK